MGKQFSGMKTRFHWIPEEAKGQGHVCFNKLYSEIEKSQNIKRRAKVLIPMANIAQPEL